MSTATIFDIQKFSIHDGPGIRTTVFVKGCPLSCAWCHNPGSQRRPPELVYDPELCLRCRTCEAACPEHAITFDGERMVTDADACTLCGECVLACTQQARAIVGRAATVDEVMAEVLKDRVFYKNSGGGVTISGGEPLAQIDFVADLLERLAGEGVHTAVDTSGWAPFSAIERAAEHTDLFLYDLKLVDSERHRQWTGVPSERILDNLRRLTAIHDHVWLRMPIIEGVNATDADVDAALAAIDGLNIAQVNLLPYHDIARHKYRKLGRDYLGAEMAVPSDETMDRFRRRFADAGHKTHIGG